MTVTELISVYVACVYAGWLTDEVWTQLLDSVNDLFGKLMS